mmetsp:Transcript_6021/g.17642  ORF Transcript_6021/g.17642 Transcript_6021/m.17642 type:complete len:248 (-) Transcript_6021:819-1562(-)
MARGGQRSLRVPAPGRVPLLQRRARRLGGRHTRGRGPRRRCPLRPRRRYPGAAGELRLGGALERVRKGHRRHPRPVQLRLLLGVCRRRSRIRPHVHRHRRQDGGPALSAGRLLLRRGALLARVRRRPDHHPVGVHQADGRGDGRPVQGQRALWPGPLRRLLAAALPPPWAAGRRPVPRRGGAGLPVGALADVPQAVRRRVGQGSRRLGRRQDPVRRRSADRLRRAGDHEDDLRGGPRRDGLLRLLGL